MLALLPAGTTGLPLLGGRLFVAHRIAWWILSTLAVATLIVSWFDPLVATGIWLLRTLKATVLIAVSAILFRRRRRDPVAAMLALAFLLWTLSSSVDFITSSAVPAIMDRFRFLLFALALLLFPDGDWRPGWTRHIAIGIATTFLLGLLEATGVLPTRLYLPIAIGCVLIALVALMVRYRALGQGMQKQQLKWVALGLFMGIALILIARAGAALTADMDVPLVGSIVLEGLFQLGIVIVAVGFLTSLLRYRLYDAEAAISRSAAYAALTLALVGTFAAVESAIELVSQNFLGGSIGNVSGAVAAAVVAVLLTPLHGKIGDWAEDHFQRDLAILKRQLPDLLIAHSGSSSLTRLAATVLPHIESAVHSTRMALLIDGKIIAAQGIGLASARRLLRGWQPPQDVQQVDRNDENPFPLRLPLRCPLGSARGWLVLGPRPDGSYYGKDDLDALLAIAPALQRTLFLVSEREDERRSERNRQRSVVRTIELLKARLDAIEGSIRAAAA